MRKKKDKFDEFVPMPKLFKVWDKELERFYKIKDIYPNISFSSHIEESEIFELSDLVPLKCATMNLSDESVMVCQSTNLCDEDGKLIFEGSIVRDFDEAIGVVYYDKEDGGYRAKSSNGDSFELVGSSRDLKVLGHILSSPELLEVQDEQS